MENKNPASTDYSICLASQSPRRRELLSGMGLSFSVKAAAVDETPPPGASPEEICRELSRRKAQAVLAALPPEIGGRPPLVIAADTLVFCDGTPLGKPKGDADAARMLHLLSGREHAVISGLTVCTPTRQVTDAVSTAVCFRALEDREIAAYVATGEPRDKAGAYGIQGRASVFVREIRGDYYSVVGLPVCRLCEILQGEFGIFLFS